MLLAIDAGNSNIKFALFEGDVVRRLWRVHSDAGRTAEEYAAFLSPLLHEAALDFDAVDAIVIGSVVPQATPALADLATHYFSVSPYLPTSASPSGLRVDYDPAGSLGIDRLADAVAVEALFGAPSIAVDLGTATTFNVVARGDEGPRFAGGAIAPGAGVLAETLARRAAQLPEVRMVKPPSTIASNSINALQSGLFHGYASLIDGMVTRIREELGEVDCPVVATGGGATEEFLANCRTVTKRVPNLTLQGLRLLYDRRAVR